MGVKYRAWDKQKKQMVYGIEETYDGLPYSELNEKVELDIYNHMSCFSSWLCGDYEVMQYVGLKDRDGVEIYERDIVENGNGKVGYIVFLIQEAGFVVVLKDRDYRLGHRNTGEGYHMAGNHKVIGNVYTSPELLEK